MPLSNNSCQLTNWPSSSNHPPPLRSHRSSEDIMANSTPEPSSTRLSFSIRRSLLSRRRDSFQVIPAVPQVPTKAFTLAFPKGFVDAAGTSPGSSDFPVIPVRPPLRPTQSLGSASDVSYYSSTDEQLRKKGMFVSIEELLLEPDLPAAQPGQGWRFYAIFVWLYSTSRAILAQPFLPQHCQQSQTTST